MLTLQTVNPAGIAAASPARERYAKITPEIAAALLAELKPVDIFSDSVKTVKGEKFGVRTLVSYLSPSEYLARAFGLNFRNLCPFASEACAAVCLGEHSGRMSFDGPKNARMRRTILYHLAPELFRAQFVREVRKYEKIAAANNQKLVVRANGSSDILWEREWPELFDMFPNIDFYDYTKVPLRYRRNLPRNYYLTFSRSESNWDECETVLRGGGNVAAVFAALPQTYRGFRVIDGDSHDIRLPQWDGSGVIVGLLPKGHKAKRDVSGFVIR